MKSPKRPWTRAEKSLFLAPLLILICCGVALWRKDQARNLIVVSPLSKDDIYVTSSFSPDARFVAAAYETGRLSRRGAIYRVSSHAKICTLKDPGISPLLEPYEWSRDGKLIMCPYMEYYKFPAAMGDGFAVWNTTTGQLVANVRCHLKTGRLEMHLRDGTDSLPNPPLTLRDATSNSITHAFDKLFRWKISKYTTNEHVGKFRIDETDDLKSFQISELETGKLLWKPPPGPSLPLLWGEKNVAGALLSNRQGPGNDHLLLWDGQTRREIIPPPAEAQTNFAFQPHSSTVLISYVPSGQTQYFRLMLWDYVERRVVWDISTGIACSGSQWSADGNWFVTKQFMINKIKIWVYDKTGHVVLERVSKSNFTSEFSPDDNTLALGCNGTMELVDLSKSQ